MKKLRTVLPFLVALLFATIIGGGVVAALENQDVQGTTNTTLYKAGHNITIDGTVNGDVFCAGQTVTVNATVNGDVICAAQTVDVTGHIYGSVRLVGQTVTLGSTVERNTSIVAQTANIDASSNTNGDLSLVGQTANIYGAVGRDFSGAVKTLNLYNKIGRNVTTTVSNLYLGSGASIGGNLSYTSANDLYQAQGVKIAGMVSHEIPAPGNGHSLWGGWFAVSAFFLVGLVLITLVLIAFLPKLFTSWNKKIALEHPWMSLLVGFIGSIILPALTVVLFVTIIGIPLGIFLVLAWGVTSFFTLPVTAYFIGRLILKKSPAVLAGLVGAVILGLVNLLPVAGTIIWIFAYWFGLGVILIAANRALNNQRGTKKSVQEAK